MPEDNLIILNPPRAGQSIPDNTPAPRPTLSRAEQARINGAKSRGPVTARGKAICSLNGLKHGRYMKNPTPIDIEDASYYPAFLAPYIRRLQPADPVERQLVAEIASLDWRLNRSLAFESRNIDTQFRLEQATTDFEIRELTRATTAMRKLVDSSALPNFLLRQQESLIRSRKTVYETLFRLRRAQPSPEQTPMPNDSLNIDPESEPIPDPATPRPDQGPDPSKPKPDPDRNTSSGVAAARPSAPALFSPPADYAISNRIGPAGVRAEETIDHEPVCSGQIQV